MINMVLFISSFIISTLFSLTNPYNTDLLSEQKTANINNNFIFVKFENLVRQDFSFSIYDKYENQNKVNGLDQNWQTLPWDSENTFSLQTTVFNAAYPIVAGDSIIIYNHNEKGYRISIPNSRYNNFEINFFNFLSLKNQNILDYYYRNILPNPKFPKLSSAKVTYDSSRSFLLSSLEENRISQKYYQWAKKIITLSYNTRTEKPQKPESSILLDTLNISNHYYRTFLHLYLINFKMNSSFAKVNFEDAYTVSKNNFEGAIKDYLLFFTTKNLIEKNNKLKSKFIRRFSEDTFNDTYNEYFKINYSENKQSTEKNNKNILTKVDNTVFTFNDLIKENKGKLIYVDFWASWCVPCIAEIPNSLKLAEAYKEQDVKFIYISIDSKKMDWDKARIKYGLNKDKVSFLLNSPEESEIVKRFKINEIPRYLLFDKKGNLIRANAPGPGSAELKKMMDKFMDE